MNPPPGCYFHPRCRYAQDICHNEAPAYRDLGGEHFVACHLAEQLPQIEIARKLKSTLAKGPS